MWPAKGFIPSEGSTPPVDWRGARRLSSSTPFIYFICRFTCNQVCFLFLSPKPNPLRSTLSLLPFHRIGRDYLAGDYCEISGVHSVLHVCAFARGNTLADEEREGGIPDGGVVRKQVADRWSNIKMASRLKEVPSRWVKTKSKNKTSYKWPWCVVPMLADLLSHYILCVHTGIESTLNITISINWIFYDT